ncbi:N-Formylmethionyl-tRNA deformylase [Elusimicrobium minutum Pei191]|uniref:Peptide deformylase n=1 Tax=Elusimicrobium minutum (strain Pei191) TaxID=445932 RepID=DEF_ELUMP|nr:peptide deformylase [Elusimicrobium minutum]B2KD65.1 RecName: Full=Peptide deformylase; Short=PDF; AltName: Full=Polypeptide deformylase [Elusimicrobium minutum Pei191]ACC98461.1 N-Formylmethionyl-tRNA deformylase [Elusimicrobium minutum Pei191]
MAVRRIVKYGEDILRQKLKPVDFKTLEPQLDAILQDMHDTCMSFQGAGLSANQIGLTHRIAMIFIPEKTPKGEAQKFKRYVVINPVIVSKKGCVTDEEGCLSLPGLWVEIERAESIVVHCLNEKGLPVEIHAKGFLAKALQHEIDHLDGKIFIDHADPKLKPEIKKELKKLSKNWS